MHWFLRSISEFSIKLFDKYRITIESQIFNKKNVFFDFNLNLNINTFYYLFLNILKSQISIVKKDKSV